MMDVMKGPGPWGLRVTSLEMEKSRISHDLFLLFGFSLLSPAFSQLTQLFKSLWFSGCYQQAYSFITVVPPPPLFSYSSSNMEAASISKFPIDQFPVELRVMVYEMSDPFDTFCTEKEIPWFFNKFMRNKSGCPYKKIPWARTILLSSVLNDKDALELASIQSEYRKVKFNEPYGRNFGCIYTICGDFPRAVFCELIALGGNLQALKWARTDRTCSKEPKDPSGKRVHTTPFPWDERVCSNAAKCGHFEMLMWAKEQGCPWNELTFAMAAEFGDIQMLKWLKEQECPLNKRAIYSAAYGGNLEVLKWLNELRPPKSTDWSEVTVGAAENGQLEALMWLREKDYKMDGDVLFLAAKNGHLDVVKWLHDDQEFRDKPYNCTCSAVARAGHLDVLQWLHECGYPWDRSTTYQAKKRGHSEIFEWAVSHGCPYDEDYSEESDSCEDNDELDDFSDVDDMEHGDSYEDDDDGEDELEYDSEVDYIQRGDSYEDDDEDGDEDDDEGDNEDGDEDDDEDDYDQGGRDEEMIVNSKRPRRG